MIILKQNVRTDHIFFLMFKSSFIFKHKVTYKKTLGRIERQLMSLSDTANLKCLLFNEPRFQTTTGGHCPDFSSNLG